MLKNKLSVVLFGIVASALVHAQTVDSLAGPAQALQTPLSQPYPGGSVTPPSGDGEKRGYRAGVHLTGIYASASGGQAEFMIDGRSEYYGVGDIMRGGWEVDSVSPNAVNLKKCSGAGKKTRCATKKYVYTGS